jgi:hypothetical protein
MSTFLRTKSGCIAISCSMTFFSSSNYASLRLSISMF